MRIYFSASISGGRKYLETYKKIVEHLQMHNHLVLTEHIVLDNVLELEKKLSPVDIFERDILMLQQCDAVIAEVSNPSLGVGYEICYALQLPKPTLALYQKDIFVSRMITGNTSSFLTLGEYETYHILFRLIDDFLKQVE